MSFIFVTEVEGKWRKKKRAEAAKRRHIKRIKRIGYPLKRKPIIMKHNKYYRIVTKRKRE